MLLGPVMAAGRLLCALFIHLLFHCGFPFLYIGLSVLTRATFGATMRKWIPVTILWQCCFRTLLGDIIGDVVNRVLKRNTKQQMVGRTSYLAFYLLLALFCIGLASTLGVDDYSLAFTAGAVIARDWWFAMATESNLNNIVDLLLNSTMFVYFGPIIPWSSINVAFTDGSPVSLDLGRLFALLVLILLFRRILAVLALKPLIPAIKTWSEAWFAGHFGAHGRWSVVSGD